MKRVSTHREKLFLKLLLVETSTKCITVVGMFPPLCWYGKSRHIELENSKTKLACMRRQLKS